VALELLDILTLAPPFTFDEVPAPDTTAPAISGVSVGSLTTSGAAVAWTTDESSDSQVEYGPTTSYGSSSTLNTSLVTSHGVVLTGLVGGTTYHFRVKSRDAAGNLATSSDFTFTTAAASAVVTYSADADLDNAYGRDNVTDWADLNSNENAGEITARKAWARGVAYRWINSKLRGADLAAPATSLNFTEFDLLADIEAERAGAILYQSRGVTDRQQASGDTDGVMQAHFEHAEKELDRIIGVVVAGDDDDATAQAGTFQFVRINRGRCRGDEYSGCN
jgi:hypothetical protein